MVTIIPLLVIVVIMLAVIRGATIALASTGMSRESARFQAVSALTGAGFTTTESERVVQHPGRRHIIFVLMLLGGFGLVTGMSSLILSVVDITSNPEHLVEQVALFSAVMLLV
jgi:Trk-type K+ transport system membrane component